MKTWKSLQQQKLLLYGIGLIIMSMLARTRAEYRPIMVHIKSGILPNNTEAVEVKCSSKSMSPEARGLKAGESYEWRVKTRELHRFYSIWGRYFQSWHAFQPKRDEAHRDVYWLVKEDGFYLRWDRLLNWTCKAVWETD